MPISQSLGRRVAVGGGHVSAPTVRAFFRALEVYGEEIRAVRLAARRSPDGAISASAAIPLFLVSPEDGRLAYVLDKGAPPTAEGLAAIVELIAPILARLDREILGDPEDEPGESDVVDSGTLLVFAYAERFHIAPSAVLDEPLGLFVDAIVAYARPERTGASGRAAEVLGMIVPTDVAPPIVDGPTPAPGDAVS